ncbi:uncharacterized protein LOC109409799 [Aedes albopictus]|uniref:Uncharacterized protein n=1 Tax=Aedes albopictus TaxID=7160 RepID=A0ABM2A693_AEDAL|nr:uncharacterized protein LOC109409799 [Aedes albopictus]
MFKRPAVLGAIVCFVALQVVSVLAVDTTTVVTPVTSSTTSSAVTVASATLPPKNGSCSKPPTAANLANCCSLQIPFPEDILSSCQKAQTSWLKDKKNSTCGSTCLLNYALNFPEAIKTGLKQGPALSLILMNNLGLYFDALTKCIPDEPLEKFTSKLVGEGTAFVEAFCELELVDVADCFSKEFFMKCPSSIAPNAACQAAKDFLATPCRYADLFV